MIKTLITFVLVVLVVDVNAGSSEPIIRTLAYQYYREKATDKYCMPSSCQQILLQYKTNDHGIFRCERKSSSRNFIFLINQPRYSDIVDIRIIDQGFEDDIAIGVVDNNILSLHFKDSNSNCNEKYSIDPKL